MPGREGTRAAAQGRAHARRTAHAAQRWTTLAELILEFDAHIQDVMATRSETEACGYQLGRALADSYWALEPGPPAGTQCPSTWWFLLGRERASEMGRLVGRLSAYFHPAGPGGPHRQGQPGTGGAGTGAHPGHA